ncbi:MAG: DNA alkylation repair protein [Flavobacteriales bacterium]
MRVYIDDLSERLELIRDHSRIEAMENYMKNNFPFLGIMSTPRRVVYRAWKETLPKDLTRQQCWEIVRELWQKEEREYHQIALDYMMSWPLKSYQKEDIQGIYFVLSNQSWWDTIDGIAVHIVGKYAKKFPEEMPQIIAEWIGHPSFWLNRTCLLYQLKWKEKTDLGLQQSYIQTLKWNKEFFIQKAIGWSLREISKWNPTWVKEVVEQEELKGLAFREAMKYVP